MALEVAVGRHLHETVLDARIWLYRRRSRRFRHELPHYMPWPSSCSLRSCLPRLALIFESLSKTVIACWQPLVRFEERNRPVILDTSDGIGDRSETYHLDDVVRCRYLVFGDAKFPRWSEIWEVLVISRFVGN